MPQSIYPTGTTIYYPEKCWNGYTVFPAELHRNNGYGAVLIDMNGNVVNRWQGLDGFPNKMLPGGHIMGSTGIRNMKYGFQDMLDLVEADWEGKIVWKFNRFERVKDPRQKARWMARQHHDYQREGNPVGYYVPDVKLKKNGITLILCHRNLTNKKISDKPIVDDVIIEVDGRGKKVWEWVCSEHFEEMGFDEAAKDTLKRNPGAKMMTNGVGDWMHMNSVSTLGPNRFYDKGDKRFHPDNIIISGRQTNIVAIIDKKTGKIAWQLGPYFTANEKLKALGQIIGQHHAHLIPRGLKGEGNLLLFDNGGAAGYGAPNPTSPDGIDNAKRDTSRVIELDPKTLEIKWQYPPPMVPGGGRLYSAFISSAQRLPNGNTMITEGSIGRIIEVTPKLEIVWEYISPFLHRRMKSNMIYRAYRLPYDWAPQAQRAKETAIPKIDNSKFRVAGSPKALRERVVRVR
ncbi:MAG: aryl-sulfate sulfotransferase [Dehalococcoidales bacterium]|nr:aryl-sulfate sulfotransferase [Dehalococcoidales bacterium]